MLVWLSVWSEVQIVCSWCHCIPQPHHLLSHFNPDWLVLSFWYQLTQVVLKRRPLNSSSGYCIPGRLLIIGNEILGWARHRNFGACGHLMFISLFLMITRTFSALTLLFGWHEGHPACKNWVVGCWRSYLSGARCRLAYGPADATATHCLLLQ